MGHAPTDFEGMPFVRLGPAIAETPLVIAVPHAGQHYPPAIERDRAVGWETLRQLEDRHADLLAIPAIDGGAAAIVATVARAWIDLNRAETELSETAGAPGTARSRAGLGLVPTRLAGRPLWRGPLAPTAIAERLAHVHRPYHAAVAAAIAQAHARYGFAVLIDCHSMPPIVREHTPPRIVLGDRHGASAAPAVMRAAEAAARRGGIGIARNTPYAGAYTLDRHGRPDAHIHAIQVEVDRSLYLRPDLADPGPGLAAMARLVAAIGWAAVAAAAAESLPAAAE